MDKLEEAITEEKVITGVTLEEVDPEDPQSPAEDGITLETTGDALIDEYRPLIYGLAATLRNRGYYLKLKEILSELNEIAREAQGSGYKNESIFLSTVYQIRSPIIIWEAIQGLYEQGMAPIRAETEAEEANNLLTSIQAALPKIMLGNDFGTLKSFVRRFAKIRNRPLDTDFNFQRLLILLNLQASMLLKQPFKADQEVAKKNAAEFIKRCEERQRRVSRLFSGANVDVVRGDDDGIWEQLRTADGVRRKPFFAGTAINSIDAMLRGFHGSGLCVLLGPSGGGKTTCLASLVANYAHEAFLERDTKEPPRIWAYIGEDDRTTYMHRAICNIINREGIREKLSYAFEGKIGLEEMAMKMNENEQFFRDVSELGKMLFRNCFWIRPPSETSTKGYYTVHDLLETFDQMMEAGDKPDFIILDYLGLMRLPADMGYGGQRHLELAAMSQILQEWGTLHKIAIWTGVQSNIEGIKAVRDLRFLEQEDLQDSKAIYNATKFMLSILPIELWDDQGRPVGHRMGLKVLKNRNGPRNGIFLSDLDFSTNTVFQNTALMEPLDWFEYVNNIMQHRASVNGVGKTDGGGPKRPKTGGGVGTQPQGAPTGGGGARPARDGLTRAAPTTRVAVPHDGGVVPPLAGGSGDKGSL